MTVLLIPLVGPMQSWGTRSRFQERDTERSPSKSGVIGLVAAALGRERDAQVNDLADLGYAVRVDSEGTVRRDYQTVLDVAKADGGVSHYAQLSNRYYLCDAAFLVALGGDGEILRAAHEALRSPVWPPYLGRRSFPPSVPTYLPDGLIETESLRSSLLSRPLLVEAEPGAQIRLELPGEMSDFEMRADQPVSFAIGRRSYADRRIRSEYVAADTIGQGMEHQHVP